MRIEELIVDGFKSYANRVCVSGWDPQFNAITGLNGSGKSNILDSICFVLGISQLKQVRANNLQELVYKQGQSRVTKASVTIVFDNSDKKGSPVGYEQFDKITVSRQVVIGGRNKYMINGHTAQQSRVKNLFHSVQLNVNNPHFLIMQGRITKVINMKPPEILAMIEEAAGTRMYETGKQSAMKTILKKQTKVTEINNILSNEITPSLEKLRREKSSYLQWTANSQEIEKLERQDAAAKFLDAKRLCDRSKDDIKGMEEQLGDLEDENVQDKQQIEELAAHIARLTQDKEAQTEGAFKDLDKKTTEHSKELVKQTSMWEHKKQEMEAETKALAEGRASVKKLAAAVKAKEAAKEKVTTRTREIEVKQKEVHDKVSSLKGQQIGITMADGQEEQGSLTHQLMDKQRAASEVEAAIAAGTSKAALLDKELKTKRKALRGDEKDHRALERECAKSRVKLTKAQEELKSYGSYRPETHAMKRKAVDDLKRVIAVKAEERDTLAAGLSRFNFEYQSPGRGFNRKSVKGLIARLIRIKDPKTATAIEVTAGRKLYQVVVDNEKTGKALLKKGKLKRRVTIIPLNKIAAKTIDKATVAEAQRLVGKDNANLALSFVGYDDEVERAMQYVFGRTIICTDAASAKKVTFDAKVRKRSVTLNGDVYDPMGTLTGGSAARKKPILGELHRLNLLDDDVNALKLRLKTLEKELKTLDSTSERIKALQTECELGTHELKLNEAKLSESPYAQAKSAADAIAAELDACVEGVKAKKTELAQLKARAKEIEASIRNFENQKKKMKQQVEKQLKAFKAELVGLTAQFKKAEQALDKAGMEHKALVEELVAAEDQVRKAEAGLEELRRQEVVLSDAVARASELYEGANKKLEEKRASLAQCDREIAGLATQKAQLEKSVANREVATKKLEHKIARMGEDAKDASKTVERMGKRYPWIKQEFHLFGKPHTDYDFKKQSPKAARKRLDKLRKTQSELSKRLNKKVMGMFERAEQEYQDLLRKRDQISKDKQKIKQVIEELDLKKNEALETTWKKVNKDFGAIFSACLPGTSAKLEPLEGKSVLDGLEVKVAFNGVWKQSLTELSGGQRSLLALSLILALLRFKPAPMYILDEVDAALDLSHTQNIGQMLKRHFPQSQFIVVSLKEGMFNNANTIFRTKFVDGVSTVRQVKGGPTPQAKAVDKENLPSLQSRRRVGKSKRRQRR